MKYSLVVYKNGYETLEIKDYSYLFGIDMNESSLNDIVKFTNGFLNEDDLKEELIIRSLIPQEYRDGKIGISYRKNKNNDPKILQYGVSFQEDKKYFDTEYLKNYFKKNINNINFLSYFINKYYNKLKDVKIYKEPLFFLNYIKECKVNNEYITEEELNYAKESIDNFINCYVLNKDSKGNYKVSMHNLRDLAMFVVNFERKSRKQKEVIPSDNENELEKLQDMLSYYQRLVENAHLSDEEFDAYIKEISKLSNKIDILSNIKGRR